MSLLGAEERRSVCRSTNEGARPGVEAREEPVELGEMVRSA